MSYNGYHTIKALVVDDFESFRQMVFNMLESFGIQSIDSAVSGGEAIRWCTEKKFDLILCDYNLGRGKNGQQILEELRFKNILTRESVFILISAESSKSIVMSAYDYEPDAYLAKPITGKVLKQRIDRLLAQRDEMLPVYAALNGKDPSAAAHLLKQKIVEGSRISTLCQKLLGDLYFSTGEFDLAEEVYRHALEVRTLDWAKVGLAKVKHAQKQTDKAKIWLHEIVKKNSLCMQAFDALADIYREEKDFDSLLLVQRQAVESSPMAILRQEALAITARQVNDNITAAHAYRQTIRLGKNSVHDKLENHINFGRTTADLLQEDQNSATDLSRETVKDLEELNSGFSLSGEESVQVMLVESQVLVGQGNRRKGQEVFTLAQKKIEKLEDERTLETDLDLVQALTANGDKDSAKKMLDMLVERYRSNQGALEKIDKLLEEPISKSNRKMVSSINQKGIGFYDGRKYREAIKCFENAKKLFPNHVGIQLNLVQALEGELGEYGFNGDTLRKAERTLNQVKRNISATHAQYDRYLQLQDMLSNHQRD